jgi:hypothetical protein
MPVEYRNPISSYASGLPFLACNINSEIGTLRISASAGSDATKKQTKRRKELTKYIACFSIFTSILTIYSAERHASPAAVFLAVW